MHTRDKYYEVKITYTLTTGSSAGASGHFSTIENGFTQKEAKAEALRDLKAILKNGYQPGKVQVSRINGYHLGLDKVLTFHNNGKTASVI